MSYWPFTMRRDTKKDERITELEAQVARLTDQNKKLAEKSEVGQKYEMALRDLAALNRSLDELMQELTARDTFIAALKADKMRLEQEAGECFETIKGLRKDVSTGIERITELEANAAEYAVASQRYVKDIAELQGECLAIASENSDLIMFVRKCATGANIRTDKPNGAKLVSDARALLKQYDSVKEQGK